MSYRKERINRKVKLEIGEKKEGELDKPTIYLAQCIIKMRNLMANR